MKSTLLILLAAAMPLCAQDAAPAAPMPPAPPANPQAAPAAAPDDANAPGCRPDGKRRGPHPRMLEKFDTNKDGQIDAQEREAMRAAREQRRAERRAKGGAPCPSGACPAPQAPAPAPAA